MYAVILAGGGGTRLHPSSRPECPKPFLPLLGERSLLQAHGRAPRGPDRRHHGGHRPALRAAGPRAGPERRARPRAARTQHRGRDRARDAGHRARRRRGHGRPAGRPDGRGRAGLPASPRRGGRGPRHRRIRHRRSAGDPRDPGRPSGDRVRLPDPGRRPRRRHRRPARLPARRASRRSRSRPGPRSWPRTRASPGTPASSCGAAARSAQALDPLHRPPPVARTDGRHAVEPASAPTRRSSGPSRSTTR